MNKIYHIKYSISICNDIKSTYYYEYISYDQLIFNIFEYIMYNEIRIININRSNGLKKIDKFIKMYNNKSFDSLSNHSNNNNNNINVAISFSYILNKENNDNSFIKNSNDNIWKLIKYVIITNGKIESYLSNNNKKINLLDLGCDKRGDAPLNFDNIYNLDFIKSNDKYQRILYSNYYTNHIQKLCKLIKIETNTESDIDAMNITIYSVSKTDTMRSKLHGFGGLYC